MLIIDSKDCENIDKALKKFKKKFERTGVIRELRRRQTFEKKSVTRRQQVLRARYRDMMQRIREIVPGCAVSSDFIVGFCGESDESFRKSMDLIRECRFKNSFIFKYSARTGTKADELFADDIPEEVKRQRNNEMLELQNRIAEEDNAEFIGRRVRILVEGPSKSATKRAAREGQPLDGTSLLPLMTHGTPDSHHHHHHDHDHDHDDSIEPQTMQHASEDAARLALQLTGRTECDRIVVFDGNPRLIGSLAEIEIHDCTSTTLLGSIVTKELQHGSGLLLPILG